MRSSSNAASLALLVTFSGGAFGQDLTFADRVRAEAAIQTVYAAHRVGADSRPRSAVPRQVHEERVRRVLSASVTLEREWMTPITPAMLEAEWHRMTLQTRMPDRLRELTAALGNNPVLIGECLVRPILVDRLMRAFARGTGTAAPGSREPDPGPDAGVAIDDTWSDGGLAPADAPRNRQRPTIVWTGSEMILWGGTTFLALDTGDRYDPVTDTWSRTSMYQAPSPRVDHTAVWTGSEMIVWGGTTLPSNLDGSRYDPETDQWTPISSSGAPAGGVGHTAVWTGTEMLVWGGFPWGEAGGRYDPVSDSWSLMPVANAPIGRTRHTAVWTGSEMIVWGGQGIPGDLNSGGRFDPAAGTWSAITTTNAPAPQVGHAAVWTGVRMIVWGGARFPASKNGEAIGKGGLYDPAADQWTALSTSGAPAAREDHSAIWTGTEMIVWGGVSNSDSASGGRYDPANDSWRDMPLRSAPPVLFGHRAVWTGHLMLIGGGSADTSAYRFDPALDLWTPATRGSEPVPRSGHTAVWTGSEMILWGGGDGRVLLETGWRYDPATASWSPISGNGAPSGRTRHTAVWTGEVMLVWGGYLGAPKVGKAGTGGRYDPATDSWRAISKTKAPLGRSYHTAVWTGQELLVWGGQTWVVDEGTLTESPIQEGARYDPVKDRWKKIKRSGEPTRRFNHSSVWTGTEMIIWGGDDRSLFLRGDGARYDPALNRWSPTSSAGAPSVRASHSAVWTGDRMIVWGGQDVTAVPFSTSPLDTGALYDPATDSWTPVTASGAPHARSGHSAFRANGLMVIWGGDGGGNTGARYDPVSDQWTPTTLLGAPSARFDESVVWTGTEMIVWGGYDYHGPLDDGALYTIAP